MKGDPEKVLAQAPHIIEGEVSVGGQEHLYLETIGAIAVPKECNEMEIFTATHGLDTIQVRCVFEFIFLILMLLLANLAKTK